MPLLLRLQELQGKGDEGWGKKCLCIVFRQTTEKIANVLLFLFLGFFFCFFFARSSTNKLLLLPDTF